MEAIIKDGSRQLKVQEGQRVEIDYRDGLEPGASVEFGEVLYVREEGSSPRFGAPLVDGAKVVGKVIGHVKGPKLVVMHFRRRKNSKTRVGHRQSYTQVEIETIQA